MAGEDAVSYIFGGNTGLTYEQLKRRRAVALALASQRRGYPKTVGEGMTYLGESIGDMLAERRLDAAEKGYLAKQSATLAGLMPGAPSAAPVSAPARPGAAPTPIAPRPAPPPPVRPPPAPAPPRPQVSMMPVRPAPVDPYGATEGTGEGFAPGGILNPTPMTSELTPPPGFRGDLYPQEGTPAYSTVIPPADAAAPPSNAPAPATAPPVSAMDYASWPQGPIRRPTDTAVEPGTPGAAAAPPAAPAAPLRPQSGIQLTPEQRDVLARTIYGEASNQADVGQQAVANVILNRARLAGTAPDYEAKKKNQFEPWWNAAARARMERLSTEDPAYGRAQAAIDAALAGDPTGGATHFYSPSVQAALGRRMPSWDTGGGQMIGTHKFLQLPYGGRQPGAAPEPPPSELAAFDRPLPQRGGEGATLASYAQPGVMSDAPPPGIGSAGGNIRFRSDPFQPPAGAQPPPAPDEQVTPTNIEPMPPTAQLQAGQLGQLGPPVGRFSEAPTPGVAAAPPPAPAVAPPPPQEPPGGIPGPLAQPTPVTPAPSLGRQTVPVPPEFNRPLVRPTPPTYPEQPSEYEIRAQRAIAANPGDPAIHEQAKALADFGKAQRDAAYMRQVEEYKKDLDLYNSLSTSREQFIRSTPERELTLRKGEEELAAKAREEERSRRLGGVAPEVLTKQIEESQKNVKNIPAATLAIANANRALLDQNMFTGSSAEMNLSMAKLLKAAGFPGDPRIEATEQFKAYISPIVAQARQAMAGGTNISDRDMMAAERAAAGDIKLERGSIKSVLDSVERINTAMAVDHQKKLLAFTGNDPDAQRVIFGTFGLPMENIVPPAAVQRLRDNATNPQAIRDFDEAFKTPGLARRMLGR